MRKRVLLSTLIVLAVLCFSCTTVPSFRHDLLSSTAVITGEKGAWDDRALESGDCFKDGDTYYWYYHSYSTWDNVDYQIGVLTSKNPLGPWERYEGNPVLKVSEKPHESYCVACPMVVKDGDRYCMIYLSAGDSPVGWGWSVSLAYADHPLGPWTKYENNPILVHQHMGYPGGLVKVKDKWYMFGTEPDEVQPDYGRMYVATADRLEGPWEVRDKPALSEGPKGSWDEAGFSEFEVLYYDGMFHAFYGGCVFNAEPKIYRREGIGYAYSKDGFNFTKSKDNPIIAYQDVPNTAAMAEVHSVIEYPYVYCYYTVRYLETPEGGNPEWMPWLEHLGVQKLVIKE